MLRFSGVTEDVINRNLEGYGALDPSSPEFVPGLRTVEPLVPIGHYRPVITYISRQHSRRRLTTECHEELVAALRERADRLGWELIIVEAEKMTKEEQVALAARTTVSSSLLVFGSS